MMETARSTDKMELTEHGKVRAFYYLGYRGDSLPCEGATELPTAAYDLGRQDAAQGLPTRDLIVEGALLLLATI